MSRGEKIEKFLLKYHYEIWYLLFGAILILDLWHSTGDTNRILFGIVAVFLSVNWLRKEIHAMRKEIKDYFRNEIDRSIINHWNLLERERKNYK